MSRPAAGARPQAIDRLYEQFIPTLEELVSRSLLGQFEDALEELGALMVEEDLGAEERAALIDRRSQFEAGMANLCAAFAGCLTMIQDVQRQRRPPRRVAQTLASVHSFTELGFSATVAPQERPTARGRLEFPAGATVRAIRRPRD